MTSPMDTPRKTPTPKPRRKGIVLNTNTLERERRYSDPAIVQENSPIQEGNQTDADTNGRKTPTPKPRQKHNHPPRALDRSISAPNESHGSGPDEKGIL